MATMHEAIIEANSLYVDEDYEGAIQKYSNAIEILKDTDVKYDSDLMEALSHRAASYLKLMQFEKAYEDCTLALQRRSKSMEIARLDHWDFLTKCRLCEALYHLGKSQEAQKLAINIFQIGEQRNNSLPISYIRYITRLKEQMDNLAKASAKDREKLKGANQEKSHVVSSEKLPTKDVKRLSNKPVSNVPKYQYHQSDTFLTIAILEPNVTEDMLTVEFRPSHLTVILHKDGKDMTIICGYLFDKIEPAKCKVRYKEKKVIIKLSKVEHMTWHELFGQGKREEDEKLESKDQVVPTESHKVELSTNQDHSNGELEAVESTFRDLTSDLSKASKQTPYASSRDWNAIERELQKQEEEPEGDEALNKLFQQIYRNADEDTRRAMVKSFQTSGGTVLSTNWDEVGKTDYEKERQAPKGMEWKTWEGDKLPQKDD